MLQLVVFDCGCIGTPPNAEHLSDVVSACDRDSYDISFSLARPMFDGQEENLVPKAFRALTASEALPYRAALGRAAGANEVARRTLRDLRYIMSKATEPPFEEDHRAPHLCARANDPADPSAPRCDLCRRHHAPSTQEASR